MEPKKYQYIDSLRGLAMMMILLVHVSFASNLIFLFTGSLFGDLILNCRYSIQLFFITSSFTLTMSYYNRIGESKQTGKFFIRRFFRIAPFYYLAMIIMTFKFVNEGGFASISFGNFITNLLFLNSLFPEYTNSYVPGGWSISVEFLFYFIMPWFCSKIKNIDSAIKLVIITLIFSFITRHLIFKIVPEPYFIYYSIFSQLPIFALGILIYWVIKDNVTNIKGSTILAIGGLLVAFSYVSVPDFYLYGLISFLLVLGMSKKAYKIISNSFFASVGQVSFSMYILHFMVLSLLVRSNILMHVDYKWQAILYLICIYVAVFAITYGLSRLTYKYIEVPGQNIGKKLIKKLDQQK